MRKLRNINLFISFLKLIKYSKALAACFCLFYHTLKSAILTSGVQCYLYQLCLLTVTLQGIGVAGSSSSLMIKSKEFLPNKTFYKLNQITACLFIENCGKINILKNNYYHKRVEELSLQCTLTYLITR